MIEVEHKGTGQVVEFPDDTAPEVIQQAMSQLDDPTYLEGVVGRGEALGAAATGVVGTIAGGISGLASIPFTDDPAGVSSDVQEALTYQPRTEGGRREITKLGDLVEMGVDIANFPISRLVALDALISGQGVEKATEMMESVQERGLGRTAGDEMFERTGSPALATLSASLPTAITELAALKGAGTAADALQKGAKAATGTLQQGVRAAEATATAVAQAGTDIAKIPFQYQTPTKKRVAKLLESGSTDIETARFKPNRRANSHPKPRGQAGNYTGI